MFFRRKSSSEIVQETKKNMHDLVSLVELNVKRTDSKEFTKFLKELKEKVQFMIKGSSLVKKRYVDKIRVELDQITNLLSNHPFHHRKIDKRVLRINKLVHEIESL